MGLIGLAIALIVLAVILGLVFGFSGIVVSGIITIAIVIIIVVLVAAAIFFLIRHV